MKGKILLLGNLTGTLTGDAHRLLSFVCKKIAVFSIKNPLSD